MSDNMAIKAPGLGQASMERSAELPLARAGDARGHGRHEWTMSGSPESMHINASKAGPTVAEISAAWESRTWSTISGGMQSTTSGRTSLSQPGISGLHASPLSSVKQRQHRRAERSRMRSNIDIDHTGHLSDSILSVSPPCIPSRLTEEEKRREQVNEILDGLYQDDPQGLAEIRASIEKEGAGREACGTSLSDSSMPETSRRRRHRKLRQECRLEPEERLRSPIEVIREEQSRRLPSSKQNDNRQAPRGPSPLPTTNFQNATQPKYWLEPEARSKSPLGDHNGERSTQSQPLGHGDSFQFAKRPLHPINTQQHNSRERGADAQCPARELDEFKNEEASPFDITMNRTMADELASPKEDAGPDDRVIYGSCDLGAFSDNHGEGASRVQPIHGREKAEDSNPRPSAAEATATPGIPEDALPRHSVVTRAAELGAYLASSSYVVSLGGPPLPDLKYGIIIVPAGDESLLFVGHGDQAAQPDEWRAAVREKSRIVGKKALEDDMRKGGVIEVEPGRWVMPDTPLHHGSDTDDMDDDDREFYRRRWLERTGQQDLDSPPTPKKDLPRRRDDRDCCDKYTAKAAIQPSIVRDVPYQHGHPNSPKADSAKFVRPEDGDIVRLDLPRDQYRGALDKRDQLIISMLPQSRAARDDSVKMGGSPTQEYSLMHKDRPHNRHHHEMSSRSDQSTPNQVTSSKMKRESSASHDKLGYCYTVSSTKDSIATRDTYPMPMHLERRDRAHSRAVKKETNDKRMSSRPVRTILPRDSLSLYPVSVSLQAGPVNSSSPILERFPMSTERLQDGMDVSLPYRTILDYARSERSEDRQSVVSRGIKTPSASELSIVLLEPDTTPSSPRRAASIGGGGAARTSARSSAKAPQQTLHARDPAPLSPGACQALELLLGGGQEAESRPRRGRRSVLAAFLHPDSIRRRSVAGLGSKFRSPGAAAAPVADTILKRDVLLELSSALLHLAQGEMSTNPGIEPQVWKDALEKLDSRRAPLVGA